MNFFFFCLIYFKQFKLAKTLEYDEAKWKSLIAITTIYIFI